jgi:hypothetical protein
MSKLKFTSKFNKVENIDAGFLIVPATIEKALGGRGRVKVHSWIGGAYYRGTLVRMEKGGPLLLLVTKKVRAEAGINFGNMVNVELVEDRDVRDVVIPDDLNKVFSKNKEAKELFDKLSYTHRKEYINWITEAKKTETRANRVVKCIEMLLMKRKHPIDKG